MLDERLFANLLALVRAASVYRELLEHYLKQQVNDVGQGKSLNELVADTWQIYEKVARAEERFFSALDALDER